MRQCGRTVGGGAEKRYRLEGVSETALGYLPLLGLHLCPPDFKSKACTCAVTMKLNAQQRLCGAQGSYAYMYISSLTLSSKHHQREAMQLAGYIYVYTHGYAANKYKIYEISVISEII